MRRKTHKQGDVERQNTMTITLREKEWLSFRRQWLKNNPPNHQNQYVCGICGKNLQADELELDHIKGRKGEYFVDSDNMQPTHSICNRLKGSRKIKPIVSREEYLFRQELDL